MGGLRRLCCSDRRRQWHLLTERAPRARVKRYRLSGSEIPLFRNQVEGLYREFRRHRIAES